MCFCKVNDMREIFNSSLNEVFYEIYGLSFLLVPVCVYLEILKSTFLYMYTTLFMITLESLLQN